jgi:hypothetical protein
LVAKLPVQTCRFKLRISVNLCENFGDPFLDTTGVLPHRINEGQSEPSFSIQAGWFFSFWIVAYLGFSTASLENSTIL